MINAGCPVEYVFHVGAEHISESLGGGGGIGAQTDRFDFGVVIDGPADHRHGV